MNEKSLLDQILDDFTESLSKNPSVGQKIAQSLREIINKGEYKNREVIIKLFKKEASTHEGS
jgi:hypothetical protein